MQLTGLEPQTSSIRSDRSTNWVTTTAPYILVFLSPTLRYHLVIETTKQKNCSAARFKHLLNVKENLNGKFEWNILAIKEPRNKLNCFQLTKAAAASINAEMFNFWRNPFFLNRVFAIPSASSNNYSLAWKHWARSYWDIFA